MTPTKDEAKMSTYLIKNIPQTLYRVFSAKVKLNGETVIIMSQNEVLSIFNDFQVILGDRFGTEERQTNIKKTLERHKKILRCFFTSSIVNFKK